MLFTYFLNGFFLLVIGVLAMMCIGFIGAVLFRWMNEYHYYEDKSLIGAAKRVHQTYKDDPMDSLGAAFVLGSVVSVFLALVIGFCIILGHIASVL